MDNNTSIAVTCLGMIAAIAFLAGCELLVANVVQWAWNLLVPSLFHGPSITYLMALAMCVMLGLIGGVFKSSGKSST